MQINTDLWEQAGLTEADVPTTWDELRSTAEALKGAGITPIVIGDTRDLMDDFARVLSEADTLLVTEVYSAGEAPIEGADGRAMCRAIRGRAKVEPVFVPQVEQIAASLGGLLRPGDVIAMMGAGSISGVAHDLAAQLRTLAGQTPGEGA